MMHRTSIASLMLASAALALSACDPGPSSSNPGTDAGTDSGVDAGVGADAGPPGPMKSWLDVHGAGAQRSDPKAGDPADFPEGRGPQGDAVRIYNHVRLVRGESTASNTYPIIDTGQSRHFDNASEITAPVAGAAFYGQDAAYTGLQASYTDNGDGTVTDNLTGLMWIKESGAKMIYADAAAGASSCRVGGHSDWRLPSIKELYSLMNFAGTDPSGLADGSDIPFLDTSAFTFEYGPGTSATHINDRLIDAQYASSTECVSDRALMRRAFGLNLADGRIKAYPQETVVLPTENWDMTFFVKYVRGGDGSYGQNSFSDVGDGTISDAATGLMWDRDDSAAGLNWQEALAWVQARNAENYKGHADWRLPNAKELQSLVDYARSPSTTDSPALDPLFNTSTITDEAGTPDYPWYWSGTTHQSMDASHTITGGAAVYVAFGRALGYFSIDSLNGESAGPTSCTVQAECDAAGACPSGSLGCTCSVTPMGSSVCVPTCNTGTDCPATLTCDTALHICHP